jgi:hypothetical protein
VCFLCRVSDFLKLSLALREAKTLFALMLGVNHEGFSVTAKQRNRQNVAPEAVCCGHPLAAPSL